jgi:heme A synthase
MRGSYDLMRRLHPWLLVLALIGLPLAAWRRRDEPPAVRVLYLALGCVSLVYVALQAEARYSVPLRPLLYVCAVYGLVALGRLRANRRDETHANRRDETGVAVSPAR